MICSQYDLLVLKKLYIFSTKHLEGWILALFQVGFICFSTPVFHHRISVASSAHSSSLPPSSLPPFLSSLFLLPSSFLPPSLPPFLSSLFLPPSFLPFLFLSLPFFLLEHFLKGKSSEVTIKEIKIAFWM